MTAPDSDYDEAASLLRRLRADWAALEQVTRMIAERPGDTDETLRARRSLEGMLRVSGPKRISGTAYAQAAETLAVEGRTMAAAALRALAATDRELAEAEERWRNRYARRPVTPGDRRAGGLIGTWQVRQSAGWLPGIDGALYSDADVFPRPGAEPVPAVVITTSVPTFEVVAGFADRAARAEWMADRSLSRAGVPLDSCVTGPECRSVREERVLAWMLHRGLGSAEPWPDLTANMFTTDARSEILLAWRDLARRTVRRDGWLVQAELASRLLRAPGWAAASIGPDGATASMYLHRLTQTPVTREEAESAAAWLVTQDRAATASPADGSAPAHRAVAPTQAALAESGGILPPPQAVDRPSGPVQGG